LGLLPYTEVACKVDGDAVRITKTQTRQGRGRSIVVQLRGKGTGRMTTDEIMALTRGPRPRTPFWWIAMSCLILLEPTLRLPGWLCSQEMWLAFRPASPPFNWLPP